MQGMETGPILLAIEQPQTQEKFEVTIERDDLVGDEDQIELSFQMSRNGKPETLPFLPRLAFMMKMETGIWRVSDLNLSARMPLTDPDFLKDLVDQIQEKQRPSNEAGGFLFGVRDRGCRNDLSQQASGPAIQLFPFGNGLGCRC
jgi:hypothetical protein